MYNVILLINPPPQVTKNHIQYMYMYCTYNALFKGTDIPKKTVGTGIYMYIFNVQVNQIFTHIHVHVCNVLTMIYDESEDSNKITWKNKLTLNYQLNYLN